MVVVVDTVSATPLRRVTRKVNRPDALSPPKRRTDSRGARRIRAAMPTPRQIVKENGLVTCARARLPEHRRVLDRKHATS